jgi:ribonuclease Z
MPFSVTILGSSSAIPTSKRYLTAHLLNHDERFFLIDCGEGTQFQLKRFNQKTSRINHVFISHLHGDHVYGLFGLISSMSMLGRKNALHIYAHPKLENVLNDHFRYFDTELSFPITFHGFDSKSSQRIYEDEKLEVLTIPLKHRIPCSGFVFKEKPKLHNIKKEMIEFYGLGIKDIINIKQGADFKTETGKLVPNHKLTTPPLPSKAYVYITDTKILEKVLPLISGTDVLYHEATFLETDSKIAKATYHSTAAQAATLARKANVKKLVLGHFSSRYKNNEKFLEEAISIFKNTVLAEDGMKIDV